MLETLITNAWKSLPVFLGHFGTALGVLVLGVIVYLRLTPAHETRLIKEGNAAAAVAFGAALLGLAIPLAFCLKASVNALDIVVWGLVSVVLQLSAYLGVALVFRDLEERLKRGDMAAAVTLGSTNLGIAVLNAAAVSG